MECTSRRVSELGRTARTFGSAQPGQSYLSDAEQVIKSKVGRSSKRSGSSRIFMLMLPRRFAAAFPGAFIGRAIHRLHTSKVQLEGSKDERMKRSNKSIPRNHHAPGLRSGEATSLLAEGWNELPIFPLLRCWVGCFFFLFEWARQALLPKRECC